MIYYIADLHLGDQRIFDLCRRPFSSIEEMEKEIIRRWNAKIKPSDDVYLLGDLLSLNSTTSIKVLNELNGHKHFIVGNHDLPILDVLKDSGVFDSIVYLELIEDDGRKVCLSHYPMMDWIEFNHGSYHVYGHIHNKTVNDGNEYAQIKEYYKDKLAYNCGVDVIDFEPRTLNELIKLKEENKDEPYIN